MLNIFKRLKGDNRWETFENYSMASVVLGTLVFSLGVGLTGISTKGLPVIISMMGAVLAFLSSAFLVFVWIGKEMFG